LEERVRVGSEERPISRRRKKRRLDDLFGLCPGLEMGHDHALRSRFESAADIDLVLAGNEIAEIVAKGLLIS
jgi:hypothetical protein